MSIIEIVEFRTLPETGAEILEQALSELDRELELIGGFQSRTLYREAETEDQWILDYRWDTLLQAQESMGKVSGTAAFGKVMALVAEPETMRIRCGVPAT
ncbi:MAG: hypothetical protein Q4D89_05840 [Arachnia propionica]|uniref:antibiotic biosynthesis monooxygenase family protein n=1 Tax=Arachnia propionica TaxID=1750 RepID=UPI00270D2480|nr:hypothetical protein [Arachnia propionica]